MHFTFRVILAPTSNLGLPFIETGQAVDTIAALDLSIYQATIQVGDGT